MLVLKGETCRDGGAGPGAVADRVDESGYLNVCCVVGGVWSRADREDAEARRHLCLVSKCYDDFPAGYGYTSRVETKTTICVRAILREFI